MLGKEALGHVHTVVLRALIEPSDRQLGGGGRVVQAVELGAEGSRELCIWSHCRESLGSKLLLGLAEPSLLPTAW